MNDLREKLLKAGVVDKKQVRQAKHQERVKRKEKGREMMEQEKKDRDAELEDRMEATRQEDREREGERQEESNNQDPVAQLLEIAQAGAVREGLFGNRRFHFVTRKGLIPFLEMSDDLAKRIELGGAAIAELPGEDVEKYIVITVQAAARMKEIDPESVRFWGEVREPRRDFRGRPGGRGRGRPGDSRRGRPDDRRPRRSDR